MLITMAKENSRDLGHTLDTSLILIYCLINKAIKKDLGRFEEMLERRIECGFEFRSKIEITIGSSYMNLDIKIGKAYGLPDNYQKKTIFFDKIHMLPSLPEKKPENYQASLLYWIPELKGWIGFNLCSYQEGSWGPWEEDVWGPYFIPDKESHSSTEIVEEIVKLYK